MDKFTVTDDMGSVDVDASMIAYGEALTAWVAKNEVASDTIQTAVEAAFDRFPGQRLPMPALIAAAVAELNATPEQHRALTARCHGYVTAQSAKNTGRLDIAKGKGGGVARLSLPGAEIPARPSKA